MKEEESHSIRIRALKRPTSIGMSKSCTRHQSYAVIDPVLVIQDDIRSGLLKSCSKKTLGWRTSTEVLNGNTANISPFRLKFW